MPCFGQANISASIHLRCGNAALDIPFDSAGRNTADDIAGGTEKEDKAARMIPYFRRYLFVVPRKN